MGSHYEDREYDVGEPRAAGSVPLSRLGPTLLRARPRPSLGSLCGPGSGRVTWPVNGDEYALLQARRDLEQVGQILRRLALNKAEIARLRNETRAILARLAA